MEQDTGSREHLKMLPFSSCKPGILCSLPKTSKLNVYSAFNHCCTAKSEAMSSQIKPGIPAKGAVHVVEKLVYMPKTQDHLFDCQFGQDERGHLHISLFPCIIPYKNYLRQIQDPNTTSVLAKHYFPPQKLRTQNAPEDIWPLVIVNVSSSVSILPF